MMSESMLTYQVYVAPIIAMAGKDVPPGQSRSTWSPISATLISGRHDAVLVDPLMTVEQGMAVADWVSTTGKNLTTVYITHGHGDHWFGLRAVPERFPRRAGHRNASSHRAHARVVRARGIPGILATQVPGPDP
jgi:glyoxylase-like metal-dependent hydrolase (beta-lactamase superfamily II)